MQQPGDRRPIAAREWQLVKDAAQWLILRRASPDGISVGGMVAGLAAGAAIMGASGGRALWLVGAVLIGVRLLANVLDGMVAVGRGVASPAGELFNEIPDRISDSAVLIGLGYAGQTPALGWAAALLAMLTAYVRTTARAAGAPSDFRGPMAKQQRMALAIGICVVGAIVPALSGRAVEVGLWVIVAGSAVTAGRRLVGAAKALRR